MIYKIKNKEKALILTVGTSLKGKIVGYTFSQLYEILGEPTFNQPSGDEKIQFEWVFTYQDNPFTIYDWKTYDKQYSMNELTEWHVGGKSYSGDFVEKIEKKLKEKFG